MSDGLIVVPQRRTRPGGRVHISRLVPQAVALCAGRGDIAIDANDILNVALKETKCDKLF